MDAKEPSVKINVLKDTKEITCPCGHNYFKPVYSLREVSAILSGTGKNEMLQIPLLVCDKCGKAYEPSSIITG